MLAVGVAIEELFCLGLGLAHNYNYLSTVSHLSLFVLGIEVVFHLFYCSESVRYCVLYLFWQFGVCLVVTFRLENWVPAEISASSGLDDCASGFADEKLRLLEISTHVGNDAHGITSFVWKRFDHLG